MLLGLVGSTQMSLGDDDKNKKEMMPSCVGKWTDYAICDANTL